MMQNQIQPGLQRITRLLNEFRQQWPAIHVAGTNGKGSVCAYITAMLRRAHVKTGRFTSPHLIDRWDGITINDRVIRKSLFEQAERHVQKINDDRGVGASSFELLTATAFHIFNEEKIDMAVIECGMGGREDSTNVLQRPVVSVITNIGLDHQGFLGETVEEIAWHKAGILKSSVPFVTPYTSDPANSGVPIVIMREAAQVGALPVSLPQDLALTDLESLPSHQRTNMRLAMKAVELALNSLVHSKNMHVSNTTTAKAFGKNLESAMLEVQIPGRLQTLSIECLTGRKEPILIDGAHNVDAWQGLRDHVDAQWRLKSQATSKQGDEVPSVTWIMAQSSNAHKSPPEMIHRLCHSNDTVFVTGFGPVDGMPWVKPAPPQDYDLSNDVSSQPKRAHLCHEEPLLEVLKMASAAAGNGPLVICGSLYLVSDVMRLLRDAGHDPRLTKG